MPVAIATATAMPAPPATARPGYLTNIRMPSLTSNLHESSLRIVLILPLRAENPIINNVAMLDDLSGATLSVRFEHRRIAAVVRSVRSRDRGDTRGRSE